MSRWILVVSIAGTVLVPVSARAAESPDSWIWGVAAGSPQVLGATLERRMDTPVRLQAHAGTIFLVSSVGIRAVLVSSRARVAPYAFLGGGMLHTAEGEGGGAQGATGYGWGGAGLRFPADRLTWFGELGVLWGMNTDKGYESALPAIAVGVALNGRDN